MLIFRQKYKSSATLPELEWRSIRARRPIARRMTRRIGKQRYFRGCDGIRNRHVGPLVAILWLK